VVDRAPVGDAASTAFSPALALNGRIRPWYRVRMRKLGLVVASSWTLLSLGCPAETVESDTDPFLPDGTTTGSPATTTNDLTTGATLDDGATTAPPATDDGPATGDESTDGGPPPECGNNVAEGDEDCDGTDLASMACTDQGFEGGELSCDADCRGFDTSECFFFFCGNGTVQGDELCDGAEVGAETCITQGFGNGDLICNATCSGYDTSVCGDCGDKAINGNEDCEAGMLAGNDCADLLFDGGTLSCAADCSYDTSDCSMCGDGVVNGFEACDGGNLNGTTCVSLGFDAGALGCNAGTCAFDFAGCSGGQYIQDFEAGGGMPAEFSLSGSANWFVDNANPITGSFSGRSGLITHSQNCSATLNVNYAIAGTVEFTHEESSEGSFDYLQFYVDGVMQQQWSGLNAAATYMGNVAAGAHTLEWRYTKDGSVNANQDSVWVDDIVLFGGVPI
jgi:hypothetical protein